MWRHRAIVQREFKMWHSEQKTREMAFIDSQQSSNPATRSMQHFPRPEARWQQPRDHIIFNQLLAQKLDVTAKQQPSMWLVIWLSIRSLR